MKRVFIALTVIAVGAGAAFGGYRYAMQRMMPMQAQDAPAAQEIGRAHV